jgi:glycosyltransferase involved in cell wall biosynthesis
MNTKDLTLTVVLPVFNEEASIFEVISRLHAVCQKLYNESYEIIVVDDASTDNTVQIVQSLDVKLIQNNTNHGAGYSRKVGIKQASGAHIFMIDADLTYVPEDLESTIKYIPKYTQISGVRPTDHGSFVYLRIFIKFLARVLASIMTLTYIPDLNTGFKILKKSEILKFIDIIPNGFSCVTTMTVSHLLCGKKILFAPIQYMPRYGVSKFHPIKDTARLFWAIFRATYLVKPSQLVIFLIHFFMTSYVLLFKHLLLLIPIAISYFFITFINIYIRTDQKSNERIDTGL